jgi:glycine cleavage system aminomethyltransferase T
VLHAIGGITDEETPIEAGLGFALKFKKGVNFNGMFGHTIGKAIGMGYVSHHANEKVTADYINAGSSLL